MHFDLQRPLQFFFLFFYWMVILSQSIYTKIELEESQNSPTIIIYNLPMIFF